MQISAAAAAEAAPFFAVAFSPFDGEIVFLEELVRFVRLIGGFDWKCAVTSTSRLRPPRYSRTAKSATANNV